MNYTDLSEFYVKHNAKNRPGNKGTHTRIPDKKLNVLGGSYIIDDEDIADYYKLYYEHVFIKKQKEYITEKQLDEGAIALDFDFRYDLSSIGKKIFSLIQNGIDTIFLEVSF